MPSNQRLHPGGAVPPPFIGEPQAPLRGPGGKRRPERSRRFPRAIVLHVLAHSCIPGYPIHHQSVKRFRALELHPHVPSKSYGALTSASTAACHVFHRPLPANSMPRSAPAARLVPAPGSRSGDAPPPRTSPSHASVRLGKTIGSSVRPARGARRSRSAPGRPPRFHAVRARKTPGTAHSRRPPSGPGQPSRLGAKARL